MVGKFKAFGARCQRVGPGAFGLCWVPAALLLAACAAPGQATPPLTLVNQVRISPRLVTAGQPTHEQLGRLRESGIDVVLHITSGTEPSAIAREQALVEAQRLRYVAVTVDPNALTADDQRAVFAVLDATTHARVLVHCDLNVLAAAFVFLHRVLVEKVDVWQARSELERVHLPPPVIRRFLEERLRAAGLSFDDG